MRASLLLILAFAVLAMVATGAESDARADPVAPADPVWGPAGPPSHGHHDTGNNGSIYVRASDGNLIWNPQSGSPYGETAFGPTQDDGNYWWAETWVDGVRWLILIEMNWPKPPEYQYSVGYCPEGGGVIWVEQGTFD